MLALDLQELHREALADYRQLVLGIVADDRTPDHAEVRQVLTLCGKTPADLLRDTELFRERMASVEAIVTAEQQRKLAEAHFAEHRQLTAQLEALAAEYQRQAQPLQAKLTEAEAAGRAQSHTASRMKAQALQFLTKTADRSIDAKLRTVQEAIDNNRATLTAFNTDAQRKLELEKTLAELGPQIEKLSRLVAALPGHGSKQSHELSQRTAMKAKIERDLARIARQESERSKIEAELSRLEGEKQSLAASRLDWRSAELASEKRPDLVTHQ